MKPIYLFPGLLLAATVAARGNGETLFSVYSVYGQIRTRVSMTQIGNMLKLAAKDTDGDGVLELPWASVPGTDGWGKAWRLCTWDRSAVDANRPFAALVSSGADRVFQTDCVAAETAWQGDDQGIRLMLPDARDVSHAVEARKSGLFRAPVAGLADLQSLDPSALRKGEEVLVLGNHQTYGWDGAQWIHLTSTLDPAIHMPDDPPVPPSVAVTSPSILKCGGGSCLAALSNDAILLFAGGQTYGAGNNAIGVMGGGYLQATITTLQPLATPVAIADEAYAEWGAAAFRVGTDLYVASNYNENGRLGLGDTAAHPAYVLTATDTVTAAFSRYAMTRADSQGRVWAAGDPKAYSYSNSGTNTGWTQIWEPEPGRKVVSLAGGTEHFAALTEDGTAYTMGYAGSCGVLGTGRRWGGGGSPTLPATSGMVPIRANVSAIATDRTATYVVAEGELLAAGCNYLGELGSAAALNGYTATLASTGITQVARVDAGYQFVAWVDTNGTLWARGRNQSCQIKNPASASVGTTQVDTGVVAVWASGMLGSIVWQKGDGTVWGRGYDWGHLNQGGAGVNRCSPVQIR